MEWLGLFGQYSWQFVSSSWENWNAMRMRDYEVMVSEIPEEPAVRIEEGIAEDTPTIEELQEIVSGGDIAKSDAFREWRLRQTLLDNIEQPGVRNQVKRLTQVGNLDSEVIRLPTPREQVTLRLQQTAVQAKESNIVIKLRTRTPYTERTTPSVSVRARVQALYGPQRSQFLRNLETTKDFGLRKLRAMMQGKKTSTQVIRRIMGRGLVSTIEPEAMANSAFRSSIREIMRSNNLSSLKAQLQANIDRELAWRNTPGRKAALDPTNKAEFRETRRILQERIKTLESPQRSNWQRALRRIVGSVRQNAPTNQISNFRVSAPARSAPTQARPMRSGGGAAGSMAIEFLIFIYALGETFKDEQRFKERGNEGQIFGDPELMRLRLTSGEWWQYQAEQTFVESPKEFVDKVNERITGIVQNPSKLVTESGEVNAIDSLITNISNTFKSSSSGDISDIVSGLLTPVTYNHNHREFHTHPPVDMSEAGLS